MIWDLHCHLSGVNGRTPDERMAQLIEYADRMGVDRLSMVLLDKHSIREVLLFPALRKEE